MANSYHTIQETLQEFQAQFIKNTYPPPQPAIEVDLVRTKHFSKEELSPIVLCALEFMHNHLFDRQLTITQLKKACNINGNSLSGEFKYYIGKTPKKYINIYRVEASISVLRDDRLKEVVILHIASAVGYRRPSTFTKAFKNIMGTPPSEWRGHLK